MTGELQCDVVAVVGDARLRAADNIRPDVADIMMPGLDGIAAMGALLARHPGTRFVLLRSQLLVGT